MNGVFTPKEVMTTLGIKKDAYYRISPRDPEKRALLGFSRVGPGMQVVHTQEQLDRYREYLNTLGEVKHGVEVGPQSMPRQLKESRAGAR